MRLWTIQGIAIYEQMVNEGIAFCTTPSWSDDDYFMYAYHWMAEQMRKRIGEPPVDDILLAVSWREIARDYMKKPASWLHEKIDGYLRNGTPVMPMSNDETKMLKDGLLDLSERIKKVANSL